MDIFDYIIVGAGSAGCVLAERLSADPKTRVLLLEAGGSDRRAQIRVPIGYGMSYHDSRVNLGGSRRSPTRKLDNPPHVLAAAARFLGGSSAINAMGGGVFSYARGLPQGFSDDWGGRGQIPAGTARHRAKTFARVERRIGPEGARGDGRFMSPIAAPTIIRWVGIT